MLILVCESLQTRYSLHFLSVESFDFWSLYGVFEQQRLISDFADNPDAPFLLEAARKAKVGQKKLKQCRPKSDCAHRSVMIKVCTV